MTRSTHVSAKAFLSKIEDTLLHTGCISRGRSSKSMQTLSIWTQQMMSHISTSHMVGTCIATLLSQGSRYHCTVVLVT